MGRRNIVLLHPTAHWTRARRSFVRSVALTTLLNCSGALLTTSRGIIVPQQLKAYGGTFSRSVGERSNHLVSDVVLQSLSPSSTHNSPLLSKNIKTKTVTSFEDMPLYPELRSALRQLRITTPSPIQQSAVEVIMQRKDTVVAAPHGEGKTLAYLLPLYQNMIKDRDVYKIPLRERRPRMILLAPTRELIAQLHHVCSVLGEATGLHAISFTSRKRANHRLSRLLKQQLVDVMIMDPKIVLRLIRARRVFLDDLRYVAVDEADGMLSSQHDHDAVHLLMKVQKRVMFKHLWPVQTQTVFATAFITRKLEFVVGKKYPDAVTCIRRQRMHRPPGTLRHRFLPVEREREKMDTLQHLLKKHGNRPREILTDIEEEQAYSKPHYLSGSLEELVELRGLHLRRRPRMERHDHEGETPIATLSSTSAGDVSNYKVEENRSGFAAKGDNADEMKERVRHALEGVRPVHWEHLTTVAAPFTCHVPRTVFADGKRCIIFTRGIDCATAVYHRLRGCGYTCSLLHAALPAAVRRRMFADFASGRTNILCSTDVAARGLDLHVDFVVNFDMPTNALTYLSRAGRTARQGRLGQVYSLYTKRQGVIVSAVRAFLQKQLPLEGISNWKRHMMEPRYAEWRTHKLNAIARSYVSLITQKTIPAHLERTYLRHNATWRPLFHPQTTGVHGGVPPRQQQRVMDAITWKAVCFRRGLLARRKGGRAKFGTRAAESGVWNDVGGITSRVVANMEQNPHPGGDDFGPPRGPPK
uniref:mt-LAF2 n=1 Tax=Trypanosoma brucei brucei TaxID=5702 RepID=UPI00178D0748|nr:Chain EB, DEAD-box helicase, putative [Trypanosoma brucei brucei]6YXY_EB Chain EB, mt-LAF2 [Trypanosoma brucei brucei]